MMKRFVVCAAVLALSLPALVEAQLGGTTVGIRPPSFDIRFSTGFNYDLLRSPTDVSFLYPVGNIGFNVPLWQGGDLQTIPSINGGFEELDGVMDDLFDDQGVNGVFNRGEYFRPNAGGGQNPNFTIKVDVPMLYGVGSFGYTQNFFLNFSTMIGESSLLNATTPIDTSIADGGAAIDLSGYLSLRSAIRIPLAVNMGWETMTFGYAYRVDDNDDLVFSLNLHRHLFSLNVRAKADIDLLGHLKLKADMKFQEGEFSINETLINEASDIIDFDSDKCNGSAMGRYRAEVWTPTIGVKLWRFTYAGRFGINTKAKGSITGRFAVPAIIDLQTGELNEKYDDLVKNLEGDPMSILDEIETGGAKSLVPQTIDSIVYQTTEPLVWKMPDGHTLGFEIIRNRLSVSYTKLFGEVSMRLNNFNRVIGEAQLADSDTEKKDIWKDIDTLHLDFGVSVDHISVIQVNFPSFYFNVGLCAFDVRAGSSKNILGRLYGDNDLEWMKFGDAVMLPVLGGGLTLGTKLQLVIDGDLLPLPALRTGFNYFF